jgi:hypothetical protein
MVENNPLVLMKIKNINSPTNREKLDKLVIREACSIFQLRHVR